FLLRLVHVCTIVKPVPGVEAHRIGIDAVVALQRMLGFTRVGYLAFDVGGQRVQVYQHLAAVAAKHQALWAVWLIAVSLQGLLQVLVGVEKCGTSASFVTATLPLNSNTIAYC